MTPAITWTNASWQSSSPINPDSVPGACAMTEYKVAKRPVMVFALLLSAAAASAQPSATPGKPGLPTENVTVSGTKSREVIQDFVNAFAARTQLIDKIARWETGICPITTGLPVRDSMFVT